MTSSQNYNFEITNIHDVTLERKPVTMGEQATHIETTAKISSHCELKRANSKHGSSDHSRDTLGETEHEYENFEPHQFSKKIIQRQRLLHALKVGLGVLITSQFVLVEILNEAFQGYGAWAVITVTIVTLATPGETTQKVINRTVGTLIGAGLALIIGFTGSILSDVLPPMGKVFVSAMNCTIAAVGTLFYTRGGTWSYAFLLGTVTFVFLSVQVLDGGSSEAIFRAAMIALGGIFGFLISWMPPRVEAADVARAYLADALLDTSVCAELVVHNFLTGKKLNAIHDISSTETDDTFHKLSKTIQVSRVPLEAAISAAAYEAAGKQGKLFHTSGLTVRLALRTLLSADMLLRQDFHPLDQSKEEEERLAIALTNVASSIRSALAKKVLDLNCTLPPAFDATSELQLTAALNELNCALHQYLQYGTQIDDTTNVINGFACHVSFARLIYDSGRFIVNTAPNMISHETQKTSALSMELGI